MGLRSVLRHALGNGEPLLALEASVVVLGHVSAPPLLSLRLHLHNDTGHIIRLGLIPGECLHLFDGIEQTSVSPPV